MPKLEMQKIVKGEYEVPMRVKGVTRVHADNEDGERREYEPTLKVKGESTS